MSADTPHIRRGMAVLALDAFGEWQPMTAETSVQGTHNDHGDRIHDFPVIWVRSKTGAQIPWPAEHVKFDRSRRGS